MEVVGLRSAELQAEFVSLGIGSRVAEAAC